MEEDGCRVVRVDNFIYGDLGDLEKLCLETHNPQWLGSFVTARFEERYPLR